MAGHYEIARVSLRGTAASLIAIAAALTAASLIPSSTESAIANGDTRSVTLSNQHTNESGSFTYMVNGVYDSATLDKLNWFLRDWRLNEPTKMDPHLFDIVWEVYRESGSREPIDVLSGYRSPQTNAMLRRRSRQVAQYSQHMEGKAIDAHFTDVSTARIRDITMRMQSGGVGFYPTGMTPWVHIDSGSVRYWPRMSRDALARLFPDGKTVFIPADGQPMPGYELARAEIESRGGQIQTASSGGGFGIFSWLFGSRGGGADDAEEGGGQESLASARGAHGEVRPQIADAGPEAVARAKRNLPTGQTFASAAQAAPSLDQGAGGARGPRGEWRPEMVDAGPDAVAKAKLNLPIGQTFASAAPTPAAPTPEAPPQSAPPVKPQVVAALDRPNVESDASPAPSRDAVVAQVVGPLPPRRPVDFESLGSLGPAPLPPARPANLVVAQQTPDPSAQGADAIATLLQRAQLPMAITKGVAAAPARALSLAELPPARGLDDNALLARAAALTAAPLPPMPIPSVGQPASPAKPQAHGAAGVAQKSAGLSTEEAERLFGGLPFDAFKPSAPPATIPSNGLRGAQP